MSSVGATSPARRFYFHSLASNVEGETSNIFTSDDGGLTSINIAFWKEARVFSGS